MKKILPLVIILGFANSAFAENGSSGWENMLNNVVKNLSSTNPQSNTQIAPAEQHDELKPEQIPPVKQVLKKEKREIILPEPPIDESEEQLAPNTRKILEEIPSGIGNTKPPKAKYVSIKRNSFDEGPGLPKPGKDDKLSGMQINLSKKTMKPDVVIKLNNALKALTSGQYEASVALYKQVLSDDNKSYDALLGLATAYQKSGQRTQARNAYGNLFELYPRDEAGLNNFLVLAANEAPQDALGELNRLAIKNPNFPSIYAQRALILSKSGDKENAISSMAQALKLSPKNNVYRYNLAVMLDDAGHYGDAVKVYQEMLEDNYRGNPMPVQRASIIERMNYIALQSKP